MFSSNRLKLIPFERHFSPEEQDNGLKKLFRKEENKSGIFNWLIKGYQMLQTEGLILSEKIEKALGEYRLEMDEIGMFFNEVLAKADGNRLKTSVLRQHYNAWAKENDFQIMNSQDFVGKLRSRYNVKKDCAKGNVLIEFDIKK